MKGIPIFINHQSAIFWFKKQYKDRFIMVDMKKRNNSYVYVYHLVADKLTYARVLNDLREGGSSIPDEFYDSYREIEIYDNGSIFLKNRRDTIDCSN